MVQFSSKLLQETVQQSTSPTVQGTFSVCFSLTIKSWLVKAKQLK